jgi:hypothetical protein
MVSAAQVSELVVQFGSGKIDSKQFLQQFALMSHNIHRCKDQEAVRLCNLFESRIGDVISGHLPLADLQRTLAADSVVPQTASVAQNFVFVDVNLVSFEEASMVVPFSASGSCSPPFGAQTPAAPNWTAQLVGN